MMGAELSVATGSADAALDRMSVLLEELSEQMDLLRGPRVHASSPVAAREPLVLLSGMLGDASLWDDVMAALGDHAAVRTSRIDLDDSVLEMADSVLAESPATFAIAGHSLGGIVALEIVRRAPHRISRLALISSSARPGSDSQQQVWSTLTERIEAGGFGAVVDELVACTLPKMRCNHAELVARSRRMAVKTGPAGLLRQLSAQQTRSNYSNFLNTIRVPVLVVSGEYDNVCPRELQQEISEQVPFGTHVVLEGVGHMAPLEAPEALADLLKNWML